MESTEEAQIVRSQAGSVQTVPAESEILQLPTGWFVEPDMVRLPMDFSAINPNDPTAAHHWIEVKRELTYAETQQLRSAGLKTIKRSGGFGVDANETEIGIDYGSFDLAKMEMWLTGWSLRSSGDKPVKCDRSAIDHLRPEVAAAILAEIDDYTEGLERLKKGMTISNG